MTKRIRGFVLAAGHGVRLRPLTLSIPKPLLPVDGEPVVGQTLRDLAGAGCEAVVLNLHHLPEAIPAFLGQSYHGLPLLYSHEKEIQGTLGALYPQREFLRPADAVVLVNGDTHCRFPWKKMIRRHLRSGAGVTLLLHRRSPDAALGGGVGVDASGRVVELRGDRIADPKSRHVFAGAHVLRPDLLERLGPGPGDIVGDFYIPLLREGCHVAAVTTGARWHDLGTPERYLAANIEALRRWRRPARSFISPLAAVDPTATVTASMIDRGVRIAEGVQVERSVVLRGAEVAAGSRIERSILGPGVRLPSAARIEGRLINRVRLGYQVDPRESVMGDLVYTPLGSELP